jgi:hypothetical protein
MCRCPTACSTRSASRMIRGLLRRWCDQLLRENFLDAVLGVGEPVGEAGEERSEEARLVKLD